MSNVLKFKALVGIAKADGEFDPAEKEFILRLADLDGVSRHELKEIINTKGKAKEFIKDLDYDSKINILIDVLQLMKIDGKVVLSEIKFCERLAKMLGFEEKSIGFLSGMIDNNPEVSINVGRISYRMKKYVIQ